MDMSREIAAWYLQRIKTAIKNTCRGGETYKQAYIRAIDIALECIKKDIEENNNLNGVVKVNENYEIKCPEYDVFSQKESDDKGGWKWETTF